MLRAAPLFPPSLSLLCYSTCVMATAELRISVLDTDAARVALCALARISEGWEDPRGIAEQALERIYEMSAREAA